MRRNYPKRVQRNPEEYYDHIYEAMPDEPHISRIIDHPRKLVTINLCADMWDSAPVEKYTDDEPLYDMEDE